MFFLDRMYRYRVIGCIEQLLLEYLGPKDGAEATGSLVEITNLLEKLGRLDLTSLVKHLRKGGLTVTDVAVSVIDGTVTSLRALTKESGQTEAAESLLTLLERALDKHMVVRPGMVVPRNGTFGRAASEHMGQLLKEFA